MPFKVTDFCANQKPICDFLLVIHTSLHPIWHHFRVTGSNWSNFRFQPLNSGPRNLASGN